MITKIACCDCSTEQLIEDLLDTEFIKCECTGGYHEFSVLEEDVEITKYFKVKILDEFIYEFKCLNNELLRKYLTDSEIISLNYGLNTVKIENDKVEIKRLGE